MSPKELFYFTARCLTLNDHPEFREIIISNFATHKVNLDDFIYLCSNHLVLPAIYLQFKKHNLLDIFPEDYKNHIAGIYIMNKKRNLDVLRQVDEINDTLHSESIIPVYLKGTACLLDKIYSDFGERMIGDIDLLVQEKDYLKSAELVMKLGYKYDGQIFRDPNTLKHFPRLYRPDVPNDIEIHRVPVDIKFSKHFNSEIIFRDIKAIPDRENCFVQSNEHKTVHSFIHSQLGNLGYWFKHTALRDLYDIHLLSKNINLISVIDQVHEKRKLTTYLILTNHLFKTNIPAELKENNSARRFIKIHSWFLNHYKIHHWYIFVVKITELLFVRTFQGIANIFTTPHSLKNSFKIITNPKWYKMILYRMNNFYSNYISKGGQ